MFVATPAQAAFASCGTPFFGGTCTTGTIYAHSTGHFVWTSVQAGLSSCSGWVEDIDTGIVVASYNPEPGKTKQGYTGGLYGRYKLTLSGVACDGYLTNEYMDTKVAS